jgi:predicted  nucleic acid-binding Zn-ribbon protein
MLEDIKKEVKSLKDKKKGLLNEMAHIQFKIDMIDDELSKLRQDLKHGKK